MSDVRRSGSLLLALAAAASGACSAPGASAASKSTRQALGATSDQPVAWYVTLDGIPAAEVYDPTHPAASLPRVRGRLATLDAQHAAIRPQVEAAGATVIGDLVRLANAFEVLAKPSDVERLQRISDVTRVERVPIYFPSLSHAVPAINAPAVWTRSTPVTGDGVTIGIVDTGLDYTHADFGGPGTTSAYSSNDPKVIEPGTFPTARVVGGWDFVGDAYDATTAANSIPAPDPDPLDCAQATNGQQISGGHGTHVAGIAAGNGVLANGTPFTGPYTQSLDPADFSVYPGVAPTAKLYSLKVFGCTGGTGVLSVALERAADPNKDGDFSDHLDVVNASLGTSYSLGVDAEAQIVANLDHVGTLFVVASGNDGNTFYSTSSPGSYPQVLSVAASATQDYVVMHVDTPASIAGNVVAAEGQFTKPLASTGVISGALVQADPPLACSALVNAGALAGKVALVDRGTCPFSDKFDAASAAGAVAVVVVDNVDSPVPFTMSGSGTTSAIPGVMVRKLDGDAIKQHLTEGVSVTLDGSKAYTGPGSEVLADFSSRGPSPMDSALKPEISAPGQSIVSAGVSTGSGSRNMSGTSMATPVVTGAAALLRSARPGLSPEQAKAILMGTATPLTDSSSNLYPVSMMGAGRVTIDKAVDQQVVAHVDSTDGSVAASLGVIVTDKPASATRTIVLENLGSADVTYTTGTSTGYDLPGVTASVTPAQIVVPAGGTAKVTLTLDVDPVKLGSPGPDPATPDQITFYNGQLYPRYYLVEAGGLVKLTDAQGAQSLAVPYNAVVRAANDRKATPLQGCAPGAGTTDISVAITGDKINPDPVVSAFQLGAVSDKREDSATNPAHAVLDLLAVGAASDVATSTDFASASAYIGVAVAGDWATPARGALSTVQVLLDTNLDGSADFEIDAEPLTRDGPYLDVLRARAYDLSTDPAQPTQSRESLNAVTPDKVRTEPFNNSVVVIPFILSDVGLTQDNARFAYSVRTQSLQLADPTESTEWVEFDANHPAIDTAVNGVDGHPVYTGDEVKVHVDPASAKSGKLPQLLLLHHTNMPGQRVDIVDLSGGESGNLALTGSAPDSVAAADKATLTLSVHNDSTAAREGVSVDATLDGATIQSIDSDAGSCKAGATVTCDLGTLDPDQTVTITVTATPAEGADSIALSAKAASTSGCETSLDDNTYAASLGITRVAPPVYSASGGCNGCRIGAEPRRSGRTALLALFTLGVVALRRSRRRD